MLKTSLTGLTVAGLMASGSAFAQENGAASTAMPEATTEAAPTEAVSPEGTVAGVIIGSEDHTTLASLVQAAGLVETLSGEGPFTVFAPKNDAFNAFPDGAVDAMKKPENKGIISRILSYHVVPGKVTSEELIAMIEAGGGSAKLTTVEGSELTATVEEDQVKITGTNGNGFVADADIEGSNGIVHSINGAVTP